MGLKPPLQCYKGIIACLAAGLFLACQPHFLAAAENPLPWKVYADRIIHLEKPETITAEGDVLLQQYREKNPTGLEIEADRIQYNIDLNSVEATGDLLLRDGPDEVRAAEARIDLAKQVGFFKQASIFWRETNITATADLIERTALNSYHFVNGKLTTCPQVKDKAPDWSIWGRDVKVSLDDYARLHHATFRIKDVPVFYLPYLRVSVRKEKKSGFLFPEYSSSDRNGAGIIAPFFINLAPNYDMTLYPGYYSDRGPLIAGEFRYLADSGSKGTFMANYLDDKLDDTPEDDYKKDGYYRTNSNRYWIRGKADHDFGNRLTAKLDVDVVSDADYLQEFQSGLIGFNRSNTYFLEDFGRGFTAKTYELRENTLQLSKIWQSTALQGEINIIDDLRQGQDIISPPWALPRMTYSGLLPFLHSPVDLTWNTEYVYYWRDEGVNAHRIDLFPQLNGPISVSPYLEASYLAGIRETLYYIKPQDALAEEIWQDGEFENRTFYNLLLNTATTLSRDYGLTFKDYKAFRHAVRPEISYLLERGTDQEDLPNLDYADRIQEKNWLLYGFNNYFRAIRKDETRLFRRDFSSFKIKQVYDIDADDHPYSDIYLELIVRGISNLFFRYDTSISVYGKGVTTYTLEANYNNRRGNMFHVDYRYKQHPDIDPPYFYTDSKGEAQHEISGNIESRISRLFSVKYDTTYSLSSDNTVDSTFSIIYHNPCWNLEFSASRNNGDDSFYLMFSLAGIGSPESSGLPEL